MLVTLLLCIVILNGGTLVGRWRHRRPPPVDEVRFLAIVAADLCAGASVRTAIATAAVGQPALRNARRMVLAGAPLGEVGGVLATLPVNGPRIAAALRVIAMAGGHSANVFARLADRAAAEADLARERRVLTTQARMSAMVIGLLPVLSLAVGGVGRIRTLMASGSAGLMLAVAGVLMQITGGTLVWRMAGGTR